MNAIINNTVVADTTNTNAYAGDYLVQMIGDDCMVWIELDEIVINIG